MSVTRILCNECGFPQAWCTCSDERYCPNMVGQHWFHGNRAYFYKGKEIDLARGFHKIKLYWLERGYDVDGNPYTEAEFIKQ